MLALVPEAHIGRGGLELDEPDGFGPRFSSRTAIAPAAEPPPGLEDRDCLAAIFTAAVQPATRCQHDMESELVGDVLGNLVAGPCGAGSEMVTLRRRSREPPMFAQAAST